MYVYMPYMQPCAPQINMRWLLHRLLKDQFGIDVTAFAGNAVSSVLGLSWQGEMPADVLSACIALRGSEDWRGKAETQFDAGVCD